MAPDERHARYIRDKLKELRLAIEGAETAGLSVSVPELTYLYLQTGVASGSEIDWKIERRL
jgi:hypothetical protein